MNRRGVALVLVLWLLVLLSFLGLEMGVFTRADTGSTRVLKERLQTLYLARAGVERGIGLLVEYSTRYPHHAFFDRDPRRAGRGDEPRPPLMAYLAARGLDGVPLGAGSYSLRFQDLSGLVNVNRADPAVLANLAQRTGLDRAAAESVADAILDWIDADDLHRARGAEREHYARRGRPLPRNSPVLGLDELLLVEGVTPDVLYGGGRLLGLERFLTTEGNGKINVNTAPPDVLLAIPGMDPGTVTRLLTERERRHLASLEDAFGDQAAQRLAAEPELGVLSFETTDLRLEAVGRLPGSGTESRVQAVVGILPSTLVVRAWRDDGGAALALAPAPVIRLPEPGAGARSGS
ncbi:MAG: general secretion pathway protein GspK [Gemmatimonadota bacterium]